MIWTQERKQGFGSPNEFGHCTYNVHFCIALRAILPRCRSSNFGPGEPQAFGCDLLMNGERVVVRTDCSFISYGQCEAMASGQDAEYGNTPADNVDPWGTRRQGRPF